MKITVLVAVFLTTAVLAAVGQEGAVETVKHGVQKAGEKVKEGAETVGEKTKEAAETVGEKTKELWRNTESIRQQQPCDVSSRRETEVYRPWTRNCRAEKSKVGSIRPSGL